MASSSVIQAVSVTHRVKTASNVLTILQDVSFEIESGETLALTGVSGAGKSTLMTLLAGLEIPTSGQISLLGQPISQLSEENRAAIRARSVGFVFQNFLLIPTLSALENVLLPQLLQGGEQDIDRAITLLQKVNLSDRLHHLPSQLSGGEQQRVALARAFMITPSVLFADEPTGNLDQQTALQIRELLFDLNRDNRTTLVLVTHDDSLAAQCHRRLHLHQGRIANVS
jgi:putative ABC transport system ATP-binding protein